MSKADRDRWDERYRAGAFAERLHPSTLLREWIGRAPLGKALDLACGAGRNALFLARNGFEVVGLDISAVGLARARASAERAGLSIDWRRQDLDEELNIDGKFQLICLFRYLNQPLIRRLPRLLAPGGMLILEVHLAVDQSKLDAPIVGPSNPAFRIKRGALAGLLPNLTTIYVEEGVLTDPDGRQVALAQLVATG